MLIKFTKLMTVCLVLMLVTITVTAQSNSEEIIDNNYYLTDPNETQDLEPVVEKESIIVEETIIEDSEEPFEIPVETTSETDEEVIEVTTEVANDETTETESDLETIVYEENTTEVAVIDSEEQLTESTTSLNREDASSVESMNIEPNDELESEPTLDQEFAVKEDNLEVSTLEIENVLPTPNVDLIDVPVGYTGYQEDGYGDYIKNLHIKNDESGIIEIVYCYNFKVAYPEPLSNGGTPGYTKGVYGDNGGDVVRQNAIRNVVYMGYPLDHSGLQQRHNLTDDQFYAVTQLAVWSITDFGTEPGDYTEAIGAELIARGHYDYRVHNRMNAAYNELKSIRYADLGIPNDFAINFYNTADSGYQNLLGSYWIRDYKEVEVGGTKTWNDNNNLYGKRPTSIDINLYRDGVVIETRPFEVPANSNEFNYTFGQLPAYNQYGKEYIYEVKEEEVAAYIASIDGYNLTNTYNLMNLDVEKVWDDSNDADGIRPENVTVQLFADEVEVGSPIELSEANDWKHEYEELPVYSAPNIKINYTLEEVTVDGYITEYSGDATEGYVVTNSHEVEKITIEGSKTWDDSENQDGKRPETITIRLLANGSEVETKVVTGPEWSWTFENLNKNANGEAINYTITEDKVDEYETLVDGYNVVNSYETLKTTVSVTKVWDDNDNIAKIRAEAVTVKLLADGLETGEELVLNADNKWTGSFVDLDLYKAGVEIVYTVEEVPVEGYDSLVDGDVELGFIITNTLTVPYEVEIDSDIYEKEEFDINDLIDETEEEKEIDVVVEEKDDVKTDEVNTLPKTGQNETILMSVVSVLLMMSGFYLITKRRAD